MSKIKAFGCMVLIIASVMLFSLANVPEVASAYTPTEEDLEFEEWVIDTLILARTYTIPLTSATDEYDSDAMELYSGLLYVFCEEKLSEIDQFVVSSEMQHAKDEFELYLEDMKKSAYYMVEVAKYYDADDIATAGNYLISSKRHLENADDIIQELTAEKDSDGDGVPDEYDYAPNDPNVQTKEDVKIPGFGAIFAIVSLLALAYLVLRRKNE